VSVIDAFVCTNLVNYTIALHGVKPGVGRRALLLYESGRMPKPALPRVWPVAIGIWSLRLLRWLAALRCVHTLYIPHHRFNRRVTLAQRHARQVAYLDDGLDTRRRVPRNFDLHALSPRSRYHTFAEYAVLPDWLAAFDVRRDTPLLQLAAAARLEVLPLDDVDHVLIESPGLRAQEIITGLRLDPRRTLVVRHPVAAKRGALPQGCRVAEGHGHSLEASMLASRDRAFYFGETMALVFAASSEVARSNRVYAQLDDAQRDNLVGLRWQPVPGCETGAARLYEVSVAQAPSPSGAAAA
jgi:hypothetical protein